MRKLAICMVTYEKVDMVIKNVYRVLNSLKERSEWKLFIYDSSVSHEIEDAIKNDERFCKYIEYKRISSDIHSNEKVYSIYSDKVIHSNYEYTWVIPDYMFFSSELIDRLWKLLEQKKDMILLNFRDMTLDEGVYSNRQTIFEKCTWFMTQYGVVVLKNKSVLSEIDWDYYYEKYMIEERRNFSHLSLYLNVLVENEALSFNILNISKKELMETPRINRQEYFKDFLEVWGEYWPNAIRSLSDEYKNKDMVIESFMKNNDALNLNNLISLRKIGRYNLKKYYQLRKDWDLISGVTKENGFWIAFLPYCFSKFFDERNRLSYIGRQKKRKKQLIGLCNTYNKIYLYGAGIWSKRYQSFLESCNIEINGLIVTSKGNQKGKYPIYEVGDISDNDQTLVILSVGEQSKQEIRNIIDGVWKEIKIFDEFLDLG